LEIANCPHPFSVRGVEAVELTVAWQEKLDQVNPTDVADSRIWEFRMNKDVLEIFKSGCVQYIHANLYGGPPEETMKKLKHDIDRRTGRLTDPTKWGIVDADEDSWRHNLVTFAALHTDHV
jgi:hypothetical protein